MSPSSPNVEVVVLQFAAVALAMSTLAVAPDTTLPPAVPDTAAIDQRAVVAAMAPTDTVRKRPRAVEVDQGYEVRLRIHRYASYATIPLFALQTIAGNQLYVNGGKAGAPGWASGAHSFGAAGLGVLFTVNTITGAWNFWDTREQAEGRTKRVIHSVLMLAADGGFAYTGIVSTGDVNRSADARRNHRNWAYASMGTALVGYGIMLIGNH
jgi:hypothetical protein